MVIPDPDTTAAALIDRICGGLRASGIDPDDPTQRVRPEDLAPVDQFHARGLAAITDLIASADLQPGQSIADLGCGSGGPARVIAERTGAHVTGYDLDADAIALGNTLITWTKQTDKVRLHQADITTVPAPDACFDVVLSVHVGMYVADKAALYTEAFRLLKPGGRLLIYDPVRTHDVKRNTLWTAPTYPLPWAREPGADHSITATEVRTALEAAGFAGITQIDRSDVCRDWFQATRARAKAHHAATGGPPPLGPHVTEGPDFREKAANIYAALRDGQIAFVEIHAMKPGPTG